MAARVMTGTIVGLKVCKLVGYPGSQPTIPEVTPAPHYLQSLCQGIKDESNLSDPRAQHTLNCDAKFQATDLAPWIEKAPDWSEISFTLLNEPHWDPAKRTDASTPAQVAWEFGVQLYCRLKLSTKNAYRALLEWAQRFSYPLTHNKAVGILSNARSMASVTPNEIPINLWQTDRWQLDKATRLEMRDTLASATKILRNHLHEGGWRTHNEHEKLSLRQLNNWDEGRARCGNSYWWIGFDSPNLEHLKGGGTKMLCKTGHACNSPGCAECAMFQSEKESGEWDWEAAYGIQFPYLMTLTVDYHHGPDKLKAAIKKMVDRKLIRRAWDGCFGAYVATAQGYSLQLMVPRDKAESNGYQQTVTEAWGEVCSKLFGKFGTVSLRRMNKPAIDCSIDLYLAAERKLFELIHSLTVDPQTGWNWFSCWIGNKPGAKGMNRVFHGPGFRKYALDFKGKLDEEAAKLPVNSDLPLVIGNLAEEEAEAEIPPERNFPRTWFSLESQVKKGYLLRAYDPYIKQVVYLDLGGATQKDIPSEYTDPVTGKPINSTTLDTSSSTGKDSDHGLTQQKAQTREGKNSKRKPAPVKPLPAEPEKFTQWAPATGTIAPPHDPWNTFSPEDRARERGTFRGKKDQYGNPISSDNQHNRGRRQVEDLTPAHFRSDKTTELTEEVELKFESKIDPDVASLILEITAR